MGVLKAVFVEGWINFNRIDCWGAAINGHRLVCCELNEINIYIYTYKIKSNGGF